ncbi:MAG TPA: glucosamine-6-phosphate deaminase [Telmatospirillum sp.]|nr:glucosamine-6-phosphate deaminase [Telmatospirillum sp.]
MPVVICPDTSALSEQAAALVAGAIGANPKLVLGLAAGASPIGLYQALLRRQAEGLDVSGVTLFGLDDYFGLAEDHPGRLRASLQRHFLSGLDVSPANIHWPDVPPQSGIAAACAAYERSIALAGGIDLQILGIGANGHIAFNEPGSSLACRTRLVHLSAATRRANAASFAPGETPEAAITQGIGTILQSRRIVLLASGESKAAAIAGAVEGPLTAMLPASALQLHPEVTLFLDPAAASQLARRDDYDAEIALLRRHGLFV